MSTLKEILDKVKTFKKVGHEIKNREIILNDVDILINEIADSLRNYAKNRLMKACDIKDKEQKSLRLYDKVHYDDGNSRNDYQIKDIDYDDCWEGIEITLEESEGEQILITKDDCSDFCTKIEDKE